MNNILFTNDWQHKNVIMKRRDMSVISQWLKKKVFLPTYNKLLLYHR